MSFFFDVWTQEGFILASDVRLIVNGEKQLAHKISRSPRNSKVVCAIAACGDYAKNCLDFFVEAAVRRDTLREITHHFAINWTERYSGTNDFSAAHLVGFERIPGSELLVPQVWYWNNWEDTVGFYREQQLQRYLSSFSDPIPLNNHLPWKVKEITGKFPCPTLQEEHDLVTSFLKLYQPVFTWNGDTKFWRSATGAVGSAMNLLWREKTTWNIMEATWLTRHCLEFLARIGNLLPDSTVGLTPEGQFDVLVITPKEISWQSRAKLPDDV